MTWHILIGHIVRGVVNYWTVYLSVPSESHLNRLLDPVTPLIV